MSTAQKLRQVKENAAIWSRGLVRLLVVLAVVVGICYSLLLNVKSWWNNKLTGVYQAGYQKATVDVANGIVEAAKAQGGIKVISSQNEAVTLVIQQPAQPYAATTTKQ